MQLQGQALTAPHSCVGAEFAVPGEVQGLAKLSLEVHILSAVREQIGLET